MRGYLVPTCIETNQFADLAISHANSRKTVGSGELCISRKHFREMLARLARCPREPQKTYKLLTKT